MLSNTDNNGNNTGDNTRDAKPGASHHDMPGRIRRNNGIHPAVGRPNVPLLIAAIAIIAITGVETAILCGKCDLMSVIMVIAATVSISVAVLSIAWWPVQGAFLTMVVWTICSLVPPSTLLLPQSLWLGVLLAVIVLARVNAFLALGMLDCTVLISLSAAALIWQIRIDSMTWGVAILILGVATLALAGIGVAQYLDRQRRRREQDERARSQEQVMLRLHDDVANRLSLASIRAHDLAKDSSDPQSRALAKDIDDALAGTRDIVRMLDTQGEAGNADNAGFETCGKAASMDAFQLVDNHLDAGRALLTEHGVEGIITNSIPTGTTVDKAQAGLIGDLLDELAINILRYGDREGGYALSVGCRGDDMTIALCDTMKSDAGAREESDVRKSRGVLAPTSQGASTGNPSKDSDGAASDCSANSPSNGSADDTAQSGTRLGLRGHARLIERHGGSMTWDQADGSFSLEAMIPLHDYTGAGD
ncbi:hypothetical protein [Bifidobacterium apri]|uniref:Signal transduction histidine kinase n=1 Tax=Bifidobacterium apri TaxID=1769423 RepID=A0A6A2VAB9_9BIFI|nr:hypothetical protein [Bifidobacterium apri]KAB8301689.1 hypothetical protein DSM100238_0008 [Bifidobacterium apri]